jgi:hypothetical protein
MNLTDAFFELCGQWAAVLPQIRTARRAKTFAFAAMLCAGRKWVTHLRCVQQAEALDWSADYKLFSRSPWRARDLFDPVIQRSLEYFGDGPIRLAGDETRTRRGGNKVKRSRYTRDPMSPPFHVNFIKGIRWVQFSALLPLHRDHDVGALSIPVSFEPVDLPAKPGPRASEEEKKAYQKAKEQNNLCLKSLDLLRDLRQRFDAAGAASKRMLVALDGGFCNQVMFRAVLDRITLVARCRKDAKLCFPAKDPDNARKVYDDKKFTPEEVRKDETIPWREVRVYFGGKYRALRCKEVRHVLWQGGAKRKSLRLLVVAPTAYKLSPGMPRYYRQPAYILVTDHDTAIKELLQCYCDRWQIEVNHRDEKQHIGIADAQVWNDNSVDRLPAFLVCTYAMLMLATLRAYGPTRTAEYQTPPRWQNKRRKRPSCVDMLRKLREEASQNPQVEQEVGFPVDLTHILLRAA